MKSLNSNFLFGLKYLYLWRLQLHFWNKFLDLSPLLNDHSIGLDSFSLMISICVYISTRFANSCMSPQCSFSMDIDKKFWKLVNNIKYQPPWLEIIGCQEKGRFPNVLSHKLPVCHRAAVAGGKPHLNISAHPTTAHFWLFITSSFHDFRLLMSINSVGKCWSLDRKTPDINYILKCLALNPMQSFSNRLIPEWVSTYELLMWQKKNKA